MAGRDRVHADRHDRPAASRRSAIDRLCNQRSRFVLRRDRHRILEIEDDRVGAALERLGHDPLLAAGREEGGADGFHVAFSNGSRLAPG
jgi:hypothetical protein